MKINHHPSQSMMEQFAQGNLDVSLSSVLSSHIDHCVTCKEALQRFEKELAEQWVPTPDKISPEDVRNQAWAQISQKIKSDQDSGKISRLHRPGRIELEGRTYSLPRSLNKLKTDELKWMPFGAGGKITKVSESNNQSLFLIYLAANEQVPLHSHSGVEHTYVISGSFACDGHEFQTGDFSSSDQSIIHAPQATSDDGCLILSSVEDRLNFFHGWLKPFNASLWWFLNWRFKRL